MFKIFMTTVLLGIESPPTVSQKTDQQVMWSEWADCGYFEVVGLLLSLEEKSNNFKLTLYVILDGNFIMDVTFLLKEFGIKLFGVNSDPFK